MKCLIVLILTIGAIVLAREPTNRAKRFAGFGTFSTVGGRIGCVVSDNGPGNASLYINSHFTKFLSEEELQELEDYKENLTQFKTDVKAFLESRQKLALERREFRQGGAVGLASRGSARGTTSSDTDVDSNRTNQAAVAGPTKQPEPPKKPSFCSEKATTQYVFDGCSVQGDNVYIGENFVRKLTQKEQEELERFDKQFTAYQKAVASNFKKQVEDIFGKHFGSIFETSSTKGSTEVPAVEPSNEASSGSATSASTPLEAPKTPNFCTLIV